MRKFFRYIDGINGSILILYLFGILVLNAFASSTVSFEALDAVFLLDVCNSMMVCFLISVVVCPFLLRFFKSKRLELTQKNTKQFERKKWGICFFCVTLSVLLIGYFANYPGCFTVDNLNQIKQAFDNQYNDWHPVLHTILAYKIPLLLSDGWIGSIVFAQILFFSAVISYALYSILIYTNKWYTFVAMFLILANPSTLNIALFALKDTAFAILTLLLVTFAIHIYFTKGEWIKKPINILAFVVVISVTTIVRHNAILFTIPLLIATMFLINKKRFIMIALCFIVLVVGIKGPLYSFLKVEAPDQRQSEMLGLPMTVIGAVVKYDNEALDEETREFAYKVASREVWTETYTYGDFNAVKFDGRSNLTVIEEYGTAKVLSMMFKCMVASPRVALKSIIKLTDPVYSITADNHMYLASYMQSNDLGLTFSGNKLLSNIYAAYSYSAYEVFAHIFMYLGVPHLFLLVSVLSKCRLNKLKDWKKIFLVLPMFIYNFGTMLLLTGSSDTVRFFYYTFLIAPVYIAILFRAEPEISEEK